MAKNPNAATINKLFETISLGSPESAIGFILWRLTARYQRETDRAFAASKHEDLQSLTNLQFVTLALAAWFHRTGAPTTQAELARFGGIHPMQLSLMLKALEAKGFITRTPSPTDTRAKQVAITPTGLKALRKALPIAIRIQERLFGPAGRPNGALHKTLLELDESSAAQELDN